MHKSFNIAPEAKTSVSTAVNSDPNQVSDVAATPNHATSASTSSADSSNTSRTSAYEHQARNQLAGLKIMGLPLREAVKNPDLRALRIEPLNLNAEAVEIPVRLEKPEREEFVHAGTDWTFPCVTLLAGSGMDRTRYLLYPEVAEALKDESKKVTYVPYQREDGSVHFWPLRHPSKSKDSWADSAIRAHERAKNRWIRVISVENAYCCVDREVPKPPPSWDGFDLDEIFAKAVSGLTIQDMDHPVVKKLRGAA